MYLCLENNGASVSSDVMAILRAPKQNKKRVLRPKKQWKLLFFLSIIVAVLALISSLKKPLEFLYLSHKEKNQVDIIHYQDIMKTFFILCCYCAC